MALINTNSFQSYDDLTISYLSKIYGFFTDKEPELAKWRTWRYFYFTKYNDVIWRTDSGSQHSTYEMINDIVNSLLETPSYYTEYKEIVDLKTEIYNVVKTDNNAYGKLSGNNNWCPVMTQNQLNNFCKLVLDEWKKTGMKKYSDYKK